MSVAKQQAEDDGDKAQLLADYQTRRKRLDEIVTRLAKELPPAMLEQTARLVHRWHNGALRVEQEGELALIHDFCIFTRRRWFKTSAEWFVAFRRPAAPSIDATLFPALRSTRYALFKVDGIRLGVGLKGRDLVRDEPCFLVDPPASRQWKIGYIIGARLLRFGELAMTTGVALPAGQSSSSGPSQALSLMLHMIGVDALPARISRRQEESMHQILLQAALATERR